MERKSAEPSSTTYSVKKDEAFLIGFDVNVDLLQDFTNDVHRLKAAMNKTRINTGGGGGTIIHGAVEPSADQARPRGTLLYDAVYLAAHDELAHEVGRKANDPADRRRGSGQPAAGSRRH